MGNGEKKGLSEKEITDKLGEGIKSEMKKALVDESEK
jgi:hypothetical protein